MGIKNVVEGAGGKKKSNKIFVKPHYEAANSRAGRKRCRETDDGGSHEYHVSAKLRNADRPEGRRDQRSAAAILANRRTVVGRQRSQSRRLPSRLRVK